MINKEIYIHNHNNFFDKIIQTKRSEIIKKINELIQIHKIENVTDVGTTNDFRFDSSNFIIRNIKKLNSYKSISDQKINKNNLFESCLKKSITEEFTQSEIDEFSSYLIISSATIEHVGSTQNQINMVSNLIKLSKKIFVFTTPNKYYPLEFHTKLPLVHWLPKKIHRKILNLLGLSFFAEEKNLNLLGENDIKKILKTVKFSDFDIFTVKLIWIKSNFIVVGTKKI